MSHFVNCAYLVSIDVGGESPLFGWFGHGSCFRRTRKPWLIDTFDNCLGDIPDFDVCPLLVELVEVGGQMVDVAVGFYVAGCNVASDMALQNS